MKRDYFLILCILSLFAVSAGTANEYVDIDAGVKGGLTYTEKDLTLLGGITFRF
jgi:hypothetical protein